MLVICRDKVLLYPAGISEKISFWTAIDAQATTTDATDATLSDPNPALNHSAQNSSAVDPYSVSL
jgi:hypothetical protein